ncbi:hypothetical protein NDU88_005134 [Pleurodeles waltl]|uniref:Uncharacterized protein n=1 Tax=Pleurodeles waltl TaxID=8319 RepID=A0AAV7V528_PLEWA|nr:hypothetical protein NDU88_005134 [Pleurodeles waltl]
MAQVRFSAVSECTPVSPITERESQWGLQAAAPPSAVPRRSPGGQSVRLISLPVAAASLSALLCLWLVPRASWLVPVACRLCLVPCGLQIVPCALRLALGPHPCGGSGVPLSTALPVARASWLVPVACRLWLVPCGLQIVPCALRLALGPHPCGGSGVPLSTALPVAGASCLVACACGLPLVARALWPTDCALCTEACTGASPLWRQRRPSQHCSACGWCLVPRGLCLWPAACASCLVAYRLCLVH